MQISVSVLAVSKCQEICSGKIHGDRFITQFANQPDVRVGAAAIHLIHRAYIHLDRTGGAVQMMLFGFSSVFSTFQNVLNDCPAH